MPGKKRSYWAIVQHSAWGYKQDPQFRRGLELRSVSEAKARQIVALGGLVFKDYGQADDYCDREMYPPEVKGLIPGAPGSFLKRKVDGLCIYVPRKEAPVEPHAIAAS